MTGQEIIDELKNEVSIDDFAYGDIQSFESIGECKEVFQQGGSGEGDHWESVKYFPDHDVYIRVTGWYSSYGGTSFNGWEDSVKEVKPQETTITVYNSI